MIYLLNTDDNIIHIYTETHAKVYFSLFRLHAEGPQKIIEIIAILANIL